MGIQFDNLTTTPHRSLSFIVEDLSRARNDGLLSAANFPDLEDWLNVLQQWSAPLVTDSGRRGIEQWLEAVESDAANG